MHPLPPLPLLGSLIKTLIEDYGFRLISVDSKIHFPPCFVWLKKRLMIFNMADIGYYSHRPRLCLADQATSL